MELDGLIAHFFGTDDPTTLSESEYERGVEREPGRKFALWTLLEALGVAPLPAEAFPKDPALKAAAEDYLKAAFRLERFGEPDA